MIRLDNVSKQIGHQILFIEASAALQKGEKIGLVGPNGAGKTTLFRMITGQEQPDEGQVAVDRGVTIGYFSQDVGEMDQPLRRARQEPRLLVVLGLGKEARTSVLVVLIVLNVLAEVVSFSRVIERVPPLRAFDRLGQRPERRHA